MSVCTGKTSLEWKDGKVKNDPSGIENGQTNGWVKRLLSKLTVLLA